MIQNTNQKPGELEVAPVVYIAPDVQPSAASRLGQARPLLVRSLVIFFAVGLVAAFAAYLFRTYTVRNQISSAKDTRNRLAQCLETNVVVEAQIARPESNTALSNCTYAVEAMLNYFNRANPDNIVTEDGWLTVREAAQLKAYKQTRMHNSANATVDASTYTDMIAYLDGDIDKLSSSVGISSPVSSGSSATPGVAAPSSGASSTTGTSSSSNGSSSSSSSSGSQGTSGTSGASGTNASPSSTSGTSSSSSAPPASTPPPASPPSSPPPVAGGKPGASNTGVPAGHALAIPSTNSTKGIAVASNGNVTISKAGTFENMLIKGRLTIKADGVTIRYSRIEATPSPYDLPNDPTSASACNSLGAVAGQQAVSAIGRSNILIEDSEIIAARKSIFLANGIHGSGYTLRRVEIAGTVDGAGAFGSGGAAANVVIQNSYIHDLYVGAYDYGHGCGASHSDGIQIHYGSNFTITNNTISPNSVTSQKSNAAIMVNENGSYKTSNVTITSNWLDYGGCSLNIARGSGSSGITRLKAASNKFGKNQSITTGGAKCAIIADNLTKALSGNDLSGNTWEDGSSPAPKITSAGW